MMDNTRGSGIPMTLENVVIVSITDAMFEALWGMPQLSQREDDGKKAIIKWHRPQFPSSSDVMPSAHREKMKSSRSKSRLMNEICGSAVDAFLLRIRYTNADPSQPP